MRKKRKTVFMNSGSYGHVQHYSSCEFYYKHRGPEISAIGVEAATRIVIDQGSCYFLRGKIMNFC